MLFAFLASLAVVVPLSYLTRTDVHAVAVPLSNDAQVARLKAPCLFAPCLLGIPTIIFGAEHSASASSVSASPVKHKFHPTVNYLLEFERQAAQPMRASMPSSRRMSSWEDSGKRRAPAKAPARPRAT